MPCCSRSHFRGRKTSRLPNSYSNEPALSAIVDLLLYHDIVEVCSISSLYCPHRHGARNVVRRSIPVPAFSDDIEMFVCQFVIQSACHHRIPRNGIPIFGVVRRSGHAHSCVFVRVSCLVSCRRAVGLGEWVLQYKYVHCEYSILFA